MRGDVREDVSRDVRGDVQSPLVGRGPFSDSVEMVEMVKLVELVKMTRIGQMDPHWRGPCRGGASQLEATKRFVFGRREFGPL